MSNKKLWMAIALMAFASSSVMAGSRSKEYTAPVAAPPAAAAQPDKVQIQGNTSINANAQNVNAVAVGQDNTAKNAVGAIRGGTQIQGNTSLKANTRNMNAVAVGKGNTVTNQVGSIGGN